ncbi:MAG: choline-sulfatase [Pseudomonadota bacterium]
MLLDSVTVDGALPDIPLRLQQRQTRIVNARFSSHLRVRLNLLDALREPAPKLDNETLQKEGGVLSTLQPNILFIQVDQLTVDVLSAYGNAVCKTPHIDALAKTGTVFRNAYCNFPLCAPSRFSMAAGLLASKIGAYDNAAEFPASVPTYAHYLRALGYRTCLSGKMHFVGPDQLHGFEKRTTTDIYPGDFEWTADWSAENYHGATDIRMLTESGVCARSVQIDYDEDVTHKAIQEIYDCARQKEQRPFFLQVSYTHPHDPYLCQPEHWHRYTDDDIPAPRIGMLSHNEYDPHSLRILKQHGLADVDIHEDVIKRARRAYCASVSYIDDNVGKLLKALDQSGQADKTIIVFCSDHGEMLGERGLWLKKTFYESALRVPLIINAPGHFPVGQCETMCSLVDLLPTFASFAAQGDWNDAVDDLDGSDLTAIANEENPLRAVYAELLCEGIPAPIFMIRRGKYKFITSSQDPDMLFDLEADPDELQNLATRSEYADVVAGFSDEAATKWDLRSLSEDIVRSQQRRLLIHKAHSQGQAPDWDFDAGDGGSDRWFRGEGNYNEWAFEYLRTAN